MKVKKDIKKISAQFLRKLLRKLRLRQKNFFFLKKTFTQRVDVRVKFDRAFNAKALNATYFKVWRVY